VSLIDSLTRRPLRLALGGLHRLLRAGWLVRRKGTLGVHAVAVTARSTIVLVKLRYAPGWRLPGGGRKEHEDAREAVLRELREEIGMTSHGEVQLVADLQETPDVKRDSASLFIVRDVEYRPSWSWEVEAVTEAPMDGLPRNLPARTSRWLALVRPYL
jgi:8-oxo-dGTP pyrophosphatase MutT (NUDIX family)